MKSVLSPAIPCDTKQEKPRTLQLTVICSVSGTNKSYNEIITGSEAQFLRLSIFSNLSNEQIDYGYFKHLHQLMLKEEKAVITAANNVLANENLFSTKSNATTDSLPTESTLTSIQEELFT